MTRDELIEMGRNAMGRNDGWRWWAPRHLTRLLDVWEPAIRADEAARHHDGGDCESVSVYTVEEFKTAIRSVAAECCDEGSR